MEAGEGGGFSWGGVEGWGEKSYNCNRITINFFFNVAPIMLTCNTQAIDCDSLLV